MPYIVTTRRPYPYRAANAVPPGATMDESHAVATLDEALTEACRIVEPYPPLDYGPRSVIDESGGTVGPLPDGTVIEVRQVGWCELVAANGGLCGHPITEWDDESLAEVLAVYNAR